MITTTGYTILLASNSPRRKQLLGLGGWGFDIEASNLDESQLVGEQPRDYVCRLAEGKAKAVLPKARKEHVIIGSDTVVVIDNEILGKPKDAEEAYEMLFRLRGRVHQVFTGIAVVRAMDGSVWSDVVVTNVPMRDYSHEEVVRYIQSGDPLDKAGAYGIQSPNFQPVKSMAGCYASVMGLPLCRLSALLRNVQIESAEDIAKNCQAQIVYDCPVFADYLQ